MLEQRRIRFASIAGIEREDLPLACEVWLNDLCSALWVTRDAMKLGNYVVRYMLRKAPTLLSLNDIESQYQLGEEEVRKALTLMRTFGAVDSFVCDRSGLRIALSLSILQRLKVLEARHRFTVLVPGVLRPWTAEAESWDASFEPALRHSPVSG